MQKCSVHKTGSFVKGSKLQKLHESETKEKCKWKSYNPKKDNPAYKKSKINNEKKSATPKDARSQSRILFDYAMSHIKKLYIQDNNREEVYALVPINSHAEFINISSSRFLNWLSDSYSKIIDSNEIHGEDFYKKISHAIESHCKINISERTKFYNRSAQLDDSIWYDLGTDDYTAIKITKNKVDTVKLGVNTPFFERTQSTYPQVLPNYDDNQNALKELAELLKIKPVDHAVFISHVTCFLFSSIPVPIMVFDGTAGSIKTTATATIKRIIDPSGTSKDDNVFDISKKPDDLIVQLEGEYMSSFDNVSYVDGDTSDILSRSITGATNVKRKLFKNKERVMLKFMSKMVLNGIIPTLEYPDLQTRIINYERLLIDDSNRILEKDFEKKLQTLIPQVLGNIFSISSVALHNYPKLSKKIRPKTRMADFEVWGEIISQISGYKKNKFLNRYHAKLKDETIKSQDAYPIISAIQSLMNGIDVYENTASDLYSKLCYISENLGINTKDKFTKFPKGSNKLVNHLKSVESNIRTCGFDIIFYYHTKRDEKFLRNSSIIKISRKEQQRQTTLKDRDTKRPLASLSPLPTPKKVQNQAQNQKSSGKDGGKDTKQHPYHKDTDSRHKKTTDKDGKGDKDTFCKDTVATDVDKITSYNKIKKSTKSFYCKTCNFGNFINIDSKSRISEKTLYEIHIESHPGHELKFSDEES